MNFSLVQSFGIDGELEQVSKEHAFTLGVEWGMAWERVKSHAAFTIDLHGENADRVAAMFITQGRKHSVTRHQNGRATIAVAGLD